MTDYPTYSSNACAVFSDEDKDRLWSAAKTLADSGNLAMRMASVFGGGVEWVGTRAAGIGVKIFGERWEEKVRETTEKALWRAHSLSTIGLDKTGDKAPWDWFNKAVTSTSGAVTGLFGLPGALLDVPLSTLVMMRSIAEIARAHGEDISDDDARRACLQVFAFGGPENADDGAEVGYWAARLSLSHVAIEAVIRRTAAIFGAALSEKMVAMAVPLAGSAAGGLLNYAFMDFYQDMARVHFTLRAIERQYGDEAGVRACFDSLVIQARDQKKVVARQDVKAIEPTR
jgi:EcsC protein family